jgi:hypothetical protein
MAEARIKLAVGAVSFSGVGEPEWLAAQLDRILTEIPNLITVAPPIPAIPGALSTNGNGGPAVAEGGFTDTLATYIKAKNGEENQVARFLAAADWLRRRGTTSLTTAAVSKALKDHQQKRLGNPADCLNQNAAKGYCEKTATGFFITPDGLKHLGH